MNPEILYKYLDNTASETEMQEVLAWLAEDEAHFEELNALDKAFNASALFAPLPQPAVRRQPLLRRIVRYTAQIAAVAVLALGVGYLLSEQRITKFAQRSMTLEVPAGRYLSLNLEDGSRVWLNSGSRLEYPLAFVGKERRVKISGEAMFDVAHDAKHPFIVETFACDVEAVGTKFNVEAIEATDFFSTDLLNGCVRVTDRSGENIPVILYPNESCSLKDGRFLIEQIGDPDEFLWTEGILSVKGNSFEELMSKFERSYDVQIIIEREKMPEINYNYGKIRVSDGIDSALRLLQLSSKFTYEKSEDNRRIYIR